MSKHEVMVHIWPDTRDWAAAMRSLGRSAQQFKRNIATRPISAERFEIQAIGRREMAGAIAEFKARNGVGG